MRLPKMTPALQDALAGASEIAQSAKASSLACEHVLLSFLADRQGSVPLLLSQSGGDLDTIERLARARSSSFAQTERAETLPADRSLASAFSLMERLRQERGEGALRSELFPLACLMDNNEAGQILVRSGVQFNTFQTLAKEIPSAQPDQEFPESSSQAISRFCLDLTARARQGKLDPVIGRENEIRRLMQILARRVKNNPVLIGEPGVGKTALVEGLAQKIIAREAPEALWRQRILSLDIAALLAGAKYRGEFEERLKKLLSEISAAPDSIILFIDEIHLLAGAGKTEGAMDAANMLKPALARGELHCIGATTLKEYRQHIEKDAALERRFQTILVEEPSVEDALSILRGLKERYESHHNVFISDAALESAARLSHRHISGRFLPDKAIDLIDEAAARVKLQAACQPEALDRASQKLSRLQVEKEALLQEQRKEPSGAMEAKIAALAPELARLETEHGALMDQWTKAKEAIEARALARKKLEDARAGLERDRRESHWDRVAIAQHETIPALEKEIASFTGLGPEQARVGPEEIAQMVSLSTGIPLDKLMAGDKERLRALSATLGAQVVGQKAAVNAVAEAVRRSRSGLADPRRPIASFLFLGPTGVGKTQLARSLADFLFDSPDAMIRIDMSEYMEKHAVSRLIGAPPGYVGHEEGGQLTEAVRRKPYSVLLFDEIEKAHPDALNILLQVLDEGRLTDSQGRLVNFRNTLIIMTSNLGSHLISSQADAAVQDDMLSFSVLNEARSALRPEFWNRIDEPVVFKSLNSQSLEEIVILQTRLLAQRLSEQGISFSIDASAASEIAKSGFDLALGARPIKRAIQQRLETPLAGFILDDLLAPGDSCRALARNERIVFENTNLAGNTVTLPGSS